MALHVDRLKDNPKEYSHEKNKKAVEICKNLSSIKHQAVKIYKMEGSPSYSEETKQFVENYFLPPLYRSSDKSHDTNSQVKFEIQRTEIERLNYFCANYPMLNTAYNVRNKLEEDISRSKTTIDHLIDTFYTEDRRKVLNRMFHSANSDIQDLLSVLVKDATEKGKIQESYDSFDFLWLEKPEDKAYHRKEGFSLLDIDSLPPNDPRFAFGDRNLSFFKEINAHYLPSIFTESDKEDKIVVGPLFFGMLDRNPFAFFSVLAHEAGHKINVTSAKINDSHFLSEYQDLLACYKDKKSIGMQQKQADEALSDYISSEVLARQIAKLPQEKRREAVLSAVESFCIVDSEENNRYHFSVGKPHPQTSFRISGIYGANPSIRRILGCQGDSPFFKTCGLKTSLLDIKDRAHKKVKVEKKKKVKR